MDKQPPETFNGNLGNLPLALEPLAAERRWVAWKWTLQKTGKWSKVPFMASDLARHASADNPNTWDTYKSAVTAWLTGRCDGIGFVLLDSGIAAVDLDHCIDLATGEVAGWAEKMIVDAGSAYVETTPSGTGLRIIGLGTKKLKQENFRDADGGGIEIEVYRNEVRYITVTGLERSNCAALPPIDDFLDRLTDEARRWKAERKGNGHSGGNGDGSVFDFNTAAAQRPDFGEVIRDGKPEGQRSEAFQSTVMHLAAQGLDVDHIIEKLAEHPDGIGKKYRGRLREEVERSYGKWREQRRESATGEEPAGAPWPTIKIVAGELPRVVNEAEAALLALGREIYQRGGMIVRPALIPVKTFHDQDTEAWRLPEVSRAYLGETLSRAAQWVKYDARRRGWVGADVPEKVVEAYQSRIGEWRLPVLAGVTGTPRLRKNGTVHDTPGYDPISGLLYKPECEFDQIPASPTREDALAAMRLFDELLAGFPFVTPADRAAMLSAILTALDRHNMPAAPMHGFSATAAGTGKSKLADIVSILATGRPCAVTAQPHSEDELEKRLGSELLAGASIITIDNCEHALQSAFLCQVLTQETARVRVLGFSKTIEAATAVSVLATGNNLQVIGDLTRRVLLCSLDAKVEHPERRHFDWDAKVVAKARRGKLVAAALTMLRAWHCSGEKARCEPLGGFEEWSARVRAPLLWLGCADPCETTQRLKVQDPHVLQLAAVMAAWESDIGAGTQVRVMEIINKALLAPDLQNALMAVAEAKGRPVISPDRLGRWLRKVEGRIVGGKALRQTGMVDGYPNWALA
jgi:hypothetical protein